jgi:hypothetical protein
MSENMPVTPTEDTTTKNNNKILIWIGVAIILCCCCAVSTFVMYQYLGDPIVNALGF